MTLPDYVTDEAIDEIIHRALDEDVGSGDITTLATISAAAQASAEFRAKQDGVLAGSYVAERVFHAVDPAIEFAWDVADGDRLETGSVIGKVRGSARGLLTGERLALNIMQRMSGIATAADAMSARMKPHAATLLDTRKTAPGLRILDKWAVLIGGGRNHRIGLYDMFLIKDNHIAAAGSIKAAVEAARDYRARTKSKAKIEVEASTLDQVVEALESQGADMILLDNMVEVRADGHVNAVRLAQAILLIAGQLPTEASGNVTIDTVQEIAATGVDFISAGVLTHSVKALDISLKIVLR